MLFTLFTIFLSIITLKSVSSQWDPGMGGGGMGGGGGGDMGGGGMMMGGGGKCWLLKSFKN